MDKSTNTTPSGPLLHETTFSVPFHLSDPVGVLFFGNIYAVVHSIFEDWAREEEVWPLWFGRADGIGFPIRHSEADYFRFMKCGETFQVTIRCASLSESTVQFETNFLQKGNVHARVRTVHTAVDLSGEKKTAIVPVLRRLWTG